MSVVPNGFSADELNVLLENARSEDECHTPNVEELNDDKLWQLAGEYVNGSLDLVDDRYAVFHKAMVMHIIGKMFDFHVSMSEELRENGCSESADNWMRDAGKLQSMMNIFASIKVDDDDFMVEASCQ